MATGGSRTLGRQQSNQNELAGDCNLFKYSNAQFMAKKIKQAAITDNDIERYLNSEDDFAFELQTLNTATEYLFEATHGQMYTDPVSGLSREYDIRGIAFHDAGKLSPDKDCSLRMAIECKHLKENNPLIVSRVPRTEAESFCDMMRSDGGIQFQPKRLKNYGFYRAGQPVGKSVTQLAISATADNGFSTGDSDVYGRWTQAIASAHDMILDSWTDKNKFQKNVVFSITMPILVIPDSTLWVIDYAVDGRRLGKPYKISECQLFLGKTWLVYKDYGKYTLSHLHIMTSQAFRKFVERLFNDMTLWTTLFPQPELK